MKNWFVLLLLVPLIACASEKEKIDIEGTRLAAIDNLGSIGVDYKPSEFNMIMPKAYPNTGWTQNGGNSMHHMGNLAAAKNLKYVWTKNFGEGNSSRDFLIAAPVVANKVIFVIDSEAKVSAFLLENGKKIWSKTLEIDNEDNTSIKGAGIAVYNKHLYVTTGFGYVFALDMVNGNELWRYNATSPLRIAPTVNNGRVFVQTIDNSLKVLSAQNGKLLWEHQSQQEPTTLIGGAAPAYDVSNDVVVAGFSNGELKAFKVSTGTLLWTDYLMAQRRINSAANINAIKANPVIADGVVYAVGNNDIMVAISLRTGERIWEKQIGSVSQPWVMNEAVYVLSNNFEIVGIEASTGKVFFNNKLNLNPDGEEVAGLFGTGPVAAGSHLIVVSSAGYAFVISPYSGKILSYIELDDGIEISPVVADGNVIFTTNEADLTVFK